MFVSFSYFVERDSVNSDGDGDGDGDGATSSHVIFLIYRLFRLSTFDLRMEMGMGMDWVVV